MVRAGAGIDYYFNAHLGIYGHGTLFRYQGSPEPTTVGFGVAVDGDRRIGVEWFFSSRSMWRREHMLVRRLVRDDCTLYLLCFLVGTSNLCW